MFCDALSIFSFFLNLWAIFYLLSVIYTALHRKEFSRATSACFGLLPVVVYPYPPTSSVCGLHYTILDLISAVQLLSSPLIVL